MTTATAERPTAEAPTAAAGAPRFDMYQPIHKALRAALCQTLVRLGAMDPDDAEDRSATLAQTRALLDQMDQHVAHENEFVHPALEAATRGSSQQIAGEHEEHQAHIQALRGDVDRVCALPCAEHALRLYRHFALFVADNLSHMHFEETAHNAVLWAGYTDAELQAVEGRLLASIPPAEMGYTLRLMLPAIHHAQRVGMIQGMRQSAPPPVVEGTLQIAQASLGSRDWSKLAAALGVPTVPGLMVA